MSGGPELIVAKGTCYPLFAYEVAQSIDLDAAERRVLAAATERLSVKQKRRAPAYFEYRPAPLRVTPGGGVPEPGSLPHGAERGARALRLRRHFGELCGADRRTARRAGGPERRAVGE